MISKHNPSGPVLVNYKKKKERKKKKEKKERGYTRQIVLCVLIVTCHLYPMGNHCFVLLSATVLSIIYTVLFLFSALGRSVLFVFALCSVIVCCCCCCCFLLFLFLNFVCLCFAFCLFVCLFVSVSVSLPLCHKTNSE